MRKLWRRRRGGRGGPGWWCTVGRSARQQLAKAAQPRLGLERLRLTEEQERHVRERLSEEELTIFDILTRPGPTLTTEERDEVKKVSRQLLERLNALLVLGWRQKAQARAGVRLAIEDGLDEGLPRAYTKETYQTKCNALFEHVYESYMGDGKSSYTEAA